MSKTLEEIQLSVHKQIQESNWFRHEFIFDIMQTALALNEEAGEYAGVIKKGICRGQGKTVEDCIEELGDVLWYLTASADILNISLDTIWEANVEKLKERRETGLKNGEVWNG